LITYSFIIFQLDAVELDNEIVNVLKNQVTNVTKFMTIGFLGRWEPEVDALLRFIIWKVCMRHISDADIAGRIRVRLLSLCSYLPLRYRSVFLPVVYIHSFFTAFGK
jgi:hypothetical protein